METKPQRSNGRNTPGRIILRWHRRIGLALSAVFLAVCVTGVFLNHSEDFNLHDVKVSSSWLYDWYDMEPEGSPNSFAVGQKFLTSFSGGLYLGTNQIAECDQLVGAVEVGSFTVAASASELLLLSPEGHLIERLNNSSLPQGTIEGIGKSSTQTALLKTSLGSFQSDEEFIEWSPVQNSANPITACIETPNEIKQALLSSYRGDGLSLYRIFLDIHSGRFFGPIGKWLADLSAFALIALTVSGIVYSMKYRPKRK